MVPLNQNPGINISPETLKTMTPAAAKEIKEALDSNFFSDQFVSVKHITHSGFRDRSRILQLFPA